MNIKEKLLLAFLIIIFVFATCKSPSAPVDPPIIYWFYAVPDTIDEGETTTLKWSTERANSVTITPGVGAVSAEGEREVAPTTTTTYTITATNSGGSVTDSDTVTVKPIAKLILDGDPAKEMTSYHCPMFVGYVKNIGTVTGYNTMIEFRAFSDVGRTTIIDTASGFPADLGNIGPGQRARFEAIFFDLYSWDQVKAWDYTISWLNRNMQREFTTGWGK